ncbi:MAG: DUF4200 domain-containing protein, partial [Alphaproteobacteria bacterium]|nr:DUF4200 domain-containing protein [Alphaproteobacteria bacterium]
LKISLIALSTLLTACGGGGSGNSVPNTTLPRAETITAMKTSVDNKSDIIDYVEGHLGEIDVAEYTEEVASKYEAIHKNNPKRSATSNAKVSSQNLTDAEKKYRIAQVKLSYVEELQNILNNLAEQSEDFLKENKSKFIDALKLIDKDTTQLEKEDSDIKEILKTVGDISSKLEDILERATLETSSLKDVKFKIQDQDSGDFAYYEVGEDNKVEKFVYNFGEKNEDGTDNKLEFNISDFLQDKNGFVTGTKIRDEFVKYYAYNPETGDLDFDNNKDDLLKDRFEEDQIHDEGFNTKVQYEVLLGGNAAKLSYSDFGIILTSMLSTDNNELNGYFKELSADFPILMGNADAFFGGYDQKFVVGHNSNNSSSGLYFGDDLKEGNNLSFTGKVIGVAHVENTSARQLNGDAELMVSLDDSHKLKETLDLNFYNFYNVKYDENGKVTFIGDDKYGKDYNGFKNLNNAENLDTELLTKYYGDNDKLEEVVGSFHLSDDERKYELTTSFGAKRK